MDVKGETGSRSLQPSSFFEDFLNEQLTSNEQYVYNMYILYIDVYSLYSIDTVDCIYIINLINCVSVYITYTPFKTWIKIEIVSQCHPGTKHLSMHCKRLYAPKRISSSTVKYVQNKFSTMMKPQSASLMMTASLNSMSIEIQIALRKITHIVVDPNR